MDYTVISECIINGNNVKHYYMETPVCNMHIVSHKQGENAAQNFVYTESDENKAKKKYKALLKSLLPK